MTRPGSPTLLRCRLALALGITLADIDATPAADYETWLAFDRIVGLPDLNLHHAHVCQTIIAAAGGKPPRLEDLVLRPIRASAVESERLSPEETATLMSRNLPSCSSM